MELEFVDRADELENVFRLVRVKPSRPRVITLDSPAGMGKTRLLFEVCRVLVRDAYRRGVEWRIVRLDFRKRFPEQEHNQNDVQYRNEEDVIEEIARQLCRDTQWGNIYDLIRDADPDDQILIQQAALIPMEDQVRQALMNAVAKISPDVREQIDHIITEAFRNVDIEEARQRGDLRSVMGLVGFILDTRHQSTPPPIPDHVLLILDGVDTITDDSLRRWMVNNLALGLGVHNGLQDTFERFAVTVSGRFVEQDLDSARKGQDFQEIVLRSFADKPVYVADLIRQFEDKAFNLRNDLVNRLARALCQVCGGHPRVIKEAASALHSCPGHFTALDMNPEGINYWYAQDKHKRPLKAYRDTAILEILEGVASQERCLLRLLSVFRKFNSATLEFLSRKISDKELHKYYDCFNGEIKGLYKNLQETRLIGNDEAKDPFDSDRFSLSLLSAQMRDEDPEMFGLLNEWAAEMFADWVKGKFSEDPDAQLQPNRTYQRVGVCEWLFHRLHLAECCSDQSSADLRGRTISSELERILDDIVPFPFEPKAAQWRRIKRDVEKDAQIAHLIWEIALEDKARHDIIFDRILQAFNEEEKRDENQ